MIATLTNHLWQSTLFVLAAALVAAALRKNGAHVRHRIWVIASLKFLVPFSLLMSLGGALSRLTPATPAMTTSSAPDLSITVDRIAQPFTNDAFFPSPVTTQQAETNWTPIGITAVWMCGFAVVTSMRFRGWRRIRAAVRASTPVPLTAPVLVRSSPGLLEPGVVGFWRPVLLLPAGIEQHLTPAQLDAILAHELCHVRRRDNLTSAIHMVVEAAFWFHPLVWFVGARLVDERERACDEHVLRVCGEPRIYAESILNVCRLYVESSVACVSGVSGADLKKRIAAIIGNRIGVQLNGPRKLTLALAATLAVMLPLIAGMLTAPLSAVAKPQTAGSAASHSGTASGPSAKFDVVSIKPCPGVTPSSGGAAAPAPGGGRGGVAPWHAQTSAGYVHWDCVTLATLVDQAYADRDHPLLNTTGDSRPPRPDALQPKRVRGGPSWVETDKFTMEAKASIDVTNPALQGSPNRNLAALPAAMSQALRATLEDRFEVKVRRATEQQDMYGLTIGKNGLNKERMQPTKPGDCVTVDEYVAADPASRGNLKICGRYVVTMTSWEFGGGTLQELGNALSSVMSSFVLDQTGVDRKFTYMLDFASVRDGGARDDDVFVRAVELLGLKMDRRKGPAEYLLIESAQKPRPNDPAVAFGAKADEPPARAHGDGRLRQGFGEPGGDR